MRGRKGGWRGRRKEVEGKEGEGRGEEKKKAEFSTLFSLNKFLSFQQLKALLSFVLLCTSQLILFNLSSLLNSPFRSAGEEGDEKRRRGEEKRKQRKERKEERGREEVRKEVRKEERRRRKRNSQTLFSSILLCTSQLLNSPFRSAGEE